MSANLQFDFLVDRQANTITVRREFAAKRQLVWDCYTRSELLDRWFAPKPLTTRTKFMDFREGGYWHYAMIMPDGTEYWSRQDYVSIQPIERYSARDGFTDETGEVNPDLPQSDQDLTFRELGDHTLVETIVTYPTLNDLEKVIKMGIQEGLASTLERLDELLPTLN
jgi:uncharacterized protein YndB with AHSA1/START domain